MTDVRFATRQFRQYKQMDEKKSVVSKRIDCNTDKK